MKISQHANERMLQMGVTRGEVDSVRAYPERTAEFAALRTHAPMQWLTLCCWAGGMTVRQTGVSLLIRDNTVVKHRMALRRKKLTPWTYDAERGTDMPGNTTEAPNAVQDGVQSGLGAIEPAVFCICVRCGPPWRDTWARPDPSDSAAARLAWGSWMALCPRCGSKRCPGAVDHSNDCFV